MQECSDIVYRLCPGLLDIQFLQCRSKRMFFNTSNASIFTLTSKYPELTQPKSKTQISHQCIFQLRTEH